jgi:uncharacterized protein (TIGR02646 family)
MIKVHKNLDDIPLTLNERKTEKRRDICIKDEKYHQKKEFHQRFKQKDIKESLKNIYKNKCAFCEQEITECVDNNLEDCSSTVEHYRPKSIYYWLAYSWDNLLWCCHRCNQNKDNKFEILNTQVDFEESFKDNIHISSILYQDIEKPLMIHPEIESVLIQLSFENGIISSNDNRVNYTIATCQLDRADLNEKRLKIIEKFKNSAKKRNRLNKSYEDILNNLKRDFMDENSEFRALKFWILKNHKALIEED